MRGPVSWEQTQETIDGSKLACAFCAFAAALGLLEFHICIFLLCVPLLNNLNIIITAYQVSIYRVKIITHLKPLNLELFSQS